MRASAWTGVTVIAALGVLGAGTWLWREAFAPAPQAETTPAPVTAAPAAAGAPSEPSVAPTAVLAEAAPGADSLDKSSLENELHALFGRNSVIALLHLEDFPRRVVATVDNLGRAHAPPALWPMAAAGGRFSVETRGDAQFISAANELRYAPHMALIEMVDMRRVFALYVKLYPRFRRAYADLGYPKRSFNARLVEVIDLILSTPRVDGALRVHLPEIHGPLQPQRPWLLYQFGDPSLQSLSSGQKILLRMGPLHGRRLRAHLAKLREFLRSEAAPR
jgi:Protein of unknown function (DUF3014)